MSAESTGETGATVAPEPAPGPAPRWRDRLLDHPLRVTFALAVPVAVGHALWIWTHRLEGAIDPDEAGYIAAALRFHGNLTHFHFVEFIRSVGGSGTGPLVPLASVPLLFLGPIDLRTVMMIQPLLMVFTAIAAAGIASRLAGPWAALAAGASVIVMPTVALATESYWLGLGAAASLAGAMWALVCSDGCRNRMTWMYGLGIAAMLLSRTMALAFLPGAVLAGVIVAWGDRARLVGLAKALGLAVIVAGPWWVVEWSTTFDYLFGYGFGPRAGRFGSGNAWDRLVFRLTRIEDGIGDTLSVVALVALAIAVVSWVWRRSRRLDEPAFEGRSAAALAAVVGLGVLALASTSNNGVWFELPVIIVLAPLVAGLAATASLPASFPLPSVIGVAAVVQAWSVLAQVWWIAPPPVTIAAHYEYGFNEYDTRFHSSQRSHLHEAAREWRVLNREVADELRRIAGGERNHISFSLSGNMELFNTNSIDLAGMLRGWDPRIDIPDTTKPAAARATDLDPTAVVRGRRVERVLILALHDKILFTPDGKVRGFAAQARDDGWNDELARFAMPRDSGDVVILRHSGGG